MPSENPDTQKTTQAMFKSNQTTKRRQQRRKKDFITNIIKGHKIIDLTRPNELSTTTSKAAT
jgi:hypothetical protein